LRVLVIGEPCIDVIHKADGRTYREHGGISYSIVGSGVLDDGIEVVPIIGLHPEDESYFRDLFRQMSSVNTAGIYSTRTRTRHVDLFYEDENNRWECCTKPIEPTTFNRIRPFLPAEGIHVNLISGNDIEIQTMKLIRSLSANSHIHLDLHNIVMQHLPDGKRVRTARRDYLEWCSYADTVQLNREEAEVIDSSGPTKQELARSILSTGTKAVVITLAENGVLLFTNESGSLIENRFLPQTSDTIDPTGCGDVFGAAFLHGILLGKDFAEAVRIGIDAATRKLSSAGPSGMLKWIESNA
jgi:sugar/nucleoside kinase (ribokinase family)